MKLNITKGTFRVEQGTKKSNGSIQTAIISSSNTHPICFRVSEHPQVIADFEFIAEAFNVANETGLTPVQLLEKLSTAIELLKVYSGTFTETSESKTLAKLAADTKQFLNEAITPNQ